MRLTHSCEYADKRKNREPMIKIRNKLFHYENIEEKHNIKSFDDLDDRLKALEIIKESVEPEIIIWKHETTQGTRYYCLGKPITKETYDLLKEVLL